MKFNYSFTHAKTKVSQRSLGIFLILIYPSASLIYMVKMTNVSEIMSTPVVTINAQKAVSDAAKLMDEKKIESLVVCWNGRAVGIFTEKDLVRRVLARDLPSDTPVREVMSKSPVMIDVKTSIKKATRVMVDENVRRLPVKDGLKVVGMVVASDFIVYESKKSSAERLLEVLSRKETP